MKTIKNLVHELQPTYNKNNSIEQVKIFNSKDIYNYAKKVLPVAIDYREAMIGFFLNNANLIVGFSTISIGGTTGTVADPRIVFQHALLSGATSIVIAHNHPSGKLNPSEADKHITNKIKSAGEFLHIKLLDHLIITEQSYYSFADEGLL